MKRLLVLAFAALAACSSEEERATDVSAAGVLPAAACDVGTRPEIGKSECSPVGIDACADGFARSDDGWGCEAIVPSEGCSGVRRARLGEVKCVPDDDCDAPFPPAAADAVVASSSELASALASVKSGGTIALDTGVYSAIEIDRDVHLVGRCAEKVRVRGPGTRGVYVVGQVKASIASIGVEGFDGGIVAAYGPEIDVAKVVLSGNQLSVVAGESTVRMERSVLEGGGASAQLAAKVTLSDVEIREASPALLAYEDDTELTMKRSYAVYMGESRTSKMIHAWGGAKVSVEESIVKTRAGALLAVGNALPGTPVDAKKARGGIVKAVASELRQTGFVREAPLATAAQGGSIDLERTSVLHESVYAFMVGDAGTTFASRASAIRSGPTDGIFRSALFVTDGASAQLEDTAIVGAIQSAVTAGHPGSRLTLSRSLVTGTVFRGPGPNAEEGGAGIAIGVGDQAELVVADSAVVGSEEFALMADGAGRAQIERTLFDATQVSPMHGGGGDAVVVTGGAVLAMSASVVRGSADAALMAVGGEGIVDETRFVGNRVGVHVTGTTLRETTTRPDAPASDELVLVNPVFVQTSETKIREAPITLPGAPRM